MLHGKLQRAAADPQARPGRAAVVAWILAAVISPLAPAATESEEPEEAGAELRLSIDAPANGSVVGDPQGMAFLSGQALALFGEYRTFDIVFAIDTSESTAAPSGQDIDGDGKVGQRGGSAIGSVFGRFIPLPSSDRGDSILAAEVAAVRTLVDQLDPRTTRVGIVIFHGDQDPLTSDAQTIVPLTTEYDKVGRGLNSVMRRGPGGMTNMVSAVNLSMIELLGTQSAYSVRRAGSKRIVMFMTDGHPTLPIDGASLQNAKMAIDHATRARKFDIQINTFALGPDALTEPLSVVEMARVTQGVFTPVRRPGDLRALFEDISFSEIEQLEIVNQTTGAAAEYLLNNADGSFSALVRMQEGRNVIEVRARSTDGTEAQRRVVVTYLPGADAQALSVRQVSQKNRLLEARLLDLQRRRLEIQTERDEMVRRQLQIEIERAREEAEERAAQMRRELEIEVED